MQKKDGVYLQNRCEVKVAWVNLIEHQTWSKWSLISWKSKLPSLLVTEDLQSERHGVMSFVGQKQRRCLLCESCPRRTLFHLSDPRTGDDVTLENKEFWTDTASHSGTIRLTLQRIFCLWLVLHTPQHVRPFKKLRSWVLNSLKAEPQPRGKRNWRLTFATLSSKPIIMSKNRNSQEEGTNMIWKEGQTGS